MSDEVSSPPLTVVIPTRDRPELLDGCLSSVRKAVRDTDEVIVVDSASSNPGVREVAEQHGVRYIRTDIPGASRARNLGWQNSSNDIVAFIDDDVRVSESWVDTMRATFNRHPDVTFVTGRILIPENQEQAVRPVATLVHADPMTFKAGSREWPGHSASLGVRREALELVAGFDERMGPGTDFKCSEEGDLYDRLYALGRIGRYEPEILGWHEQWRSHRELLRLDYIYGFGAGARISKLLKSNRVHGIKYGMGVYLQWGLQEAFYNLKRGRFFLALAALVRFIGSVQGLGRTIAVPVRNGHFVPRRGTVATDRDPDSMWDRAPRRPGGANTDRDRPSDVRRKPVQPLLRVGIDLTPGAIAITGIARYSQMLWDQLSERTDVAPRAFMAGRVARMDTASILRLHMPIRALHSLWRFGGPKAETLFGDIDIVHCIDMIAPPTRLPLVVTWHDTFRLSGLEYHDPRNLELRQKRIASLEKASVVLTYCEATAQELVEATGYPRDRIILSPPGYDIVDTGEAAPSPVDGPFILAAGALTPRKGFDVLANAMRDLGDSAPPLVIAGPDGYRADEVRKQIFDAIGPDRCILLGERYAGMNALYKQATLVAHPSLAEGFGYVCLEAMGAGAAVVAADIPSIREMGEGCVSLVPAGDHEAMAAAIASLLEDGSERGRLGALGRDRAKQYTWAHTADQTVRAYLMAAGR